MENEIFSFEKLEVWQLSRQFVTFIYKLLEKFPAVEKYAICDQIRRAAVSVPSNIAEGSSRISYKEKVHFIEIAGGSLMETYCQLVISHDLGYISDEEKMEIMTQIMRISKLLNGLRASFLRKIND